MVIAYLIEHECKSEDESAKVALAQAKAAEKAAKVRERAAAPSSGGHTCVSSAAASSIHLAHILSPPSVTRSVSLLLARARRRALTGALASLSLSVSLRISPSMVSLWTRWQDTLKATKKKDEKAVAKQRVTAAERKVAAAMLPLLSPSTSSRSPHRPSLFGR